MIRYLLPLFMTVSAFLISCSEGDRTQSPGSAGSSATIESPPQASDAKFNLLPDGSDGKILSMVGVINPGILTVVPVRVVDATGAGVGNVVVKFTGPSSQPGFIGPTVVLSAETATTDVNGYAYVTFKGASAPGMFSISVTSPSYPNMAGAIIQFSSPGIVINGSRTGRANINVVDIALLNPTNASTLISSLTSATPRIKLDHLSPGPQSGRTGYRITGRVTMNLSQFIFSPTTYGINMLFSTRCFWVPCTEAAGDGIYELQIDENGDGQFEMSQRFYRLLGDTNGDFIVDNVDSTNARECVLSPPGRLSMACTNVDMDSSRTINAHDLNVIIFQLGRRITPF